MIVLVSVISPYQEIRQEIRTKIGSFLEVYVSAPLAVCQQRDVKGHYQRAKTGELKNFTGVADPYEPPIDPEIICATDTETVAQSVDKVLEAILMKMTSN